MSDLPFHIQEEIMKRLPVISLIQFRCVSKAWKSLIDSSEFIAAHSLRRHTQPHYLFVSKKNRDGQADCDLFSRCYIDDGTFLQQWSVPTLTRSVNRLLRPSVVGCSQGLWCFYGFHLILSRYTAILWNPSVRKSVVVHIPGEPSVGFGVCPVTNDPKIVAITQSSQVMVYTLSSRKWRSLSINLPTNPTQGSNCLVTDGFIYWDVELKDLKVIMSFDLTSESFDMIDLPDSLARCDPLLIRMSKLRDSLVLLQHERFNSTSIVWMMEVGALKSFTKLFTITTPHESVVGFRENGIPFMAIADGYYFELTNLVVDDPKLEHTNILLTFDGYCNFYVHSYMETLLLLGRSPYTLY